MKAWLKQIKEIMLETFYVDQKLFWGEKIYMSGKFLKQLIHMFLLLILLMRGFYNTCKSNQFQDMKINRSLFLRKPLRDIIFICLFLFVDELSLLLAKKYVLTNNMEVLTNNK